MLNIDRTARLWYHPQRHRRAKPAHLKDYVMADDDDYGSDDDNP